MEALAPKQLGIFQGPVMWCGSPGTEGEIEDSLEGSALLWGWDLEVQAVETFKHDDVIRCVF